jgi:general secretion pathway protein I
VEIWVVIGLNTKVGIFCPPYKHDHEPFLTLFKKIMRQQGFTLLEAIVALLLITTTGIALLAWINTNLLSLTHLQQVQQRQEAMRNALAFIQTINPLEKPQGEETIGIYTFHWEAQPVILPRDGKGLYQIGLYNTTVEVKMEQKLVAQFNLRQAGFHQVYQSSDQF